MKMFPTMGGSSLVLICLMYFTGLVAAQDSNITIPLNKSITYENKELYGSYLTLNGESHVRVDFSNVNKSLYFLVFQAHSYMSSITLNMTNKYGTSVVMGTNLGLVIFTDEISTVNVLSDNKNVTVRVYISVHGYEKNDPIPGGCNMELPVNIAPFLTTLTFPDYVLVEVGAPSAPATDRTCITPLQADMTFYMMYLSEQNFYSEPYFNGLRTLMTLEGIKKYGKEIPFISIPYTRRRLSAYPGTGAIYAVVATSKNFTNKDNLTAYSVYVPNYSYGCNEFDEDSCEMIDDWLSQILCLGLMITGLFICFFGHRFFKTEMFFAGFFSGVIISYILIALVTVVDKPALLPAATVSGIFFGGIWWLFWWLYGIPVLAVLLPSLNLGFLLASIFYYRLPGNIPYLASDFNFWTLFILVMLLTALAVFSVSYAANIICCAVLGAFATVLALDYYMGSNLKFIIINVIRRATVPSFNQAFIAPPDTQWRDVAVAVMWLLLGTLGFLFQHWYNRGRPPFPPPPRSVRPSISEPSTFSYGAISSYFRRRPTNQQGTVVGSVTPIIARPYTERTGLLS
ncbi:hypothetical protein PYW07_006350 [Mythimna separata]|uniref:TM7S3/TM198-like domain-containing protein n=1 Tax=Mythimna separata TaxID=271217 RepID=A0AAD7YVM6_MYTSE|nr:hypothetical protein PYW07_006350 [Mythimna separata]